MLEGRRILVTGIVNTESIAFAVAARAQELGAEVLVTTFDRVADLTQAAISELPVQPQVYQLDAAVDDDFDRLGDQLAAGGHLDGALHAVAFAPADALGGPFLEASTRSIELAMRTSTVSYARLASVLHRLAPPSGASLVGLDFDADGRAWPVYNWMGVCKVALQAVSRYVARDLGPAGIRSNLVAAGPLHTRAASGIPDFEVLTDAYDTTAPLQWDAKDPAPVADTVCFLLSPGSRAITGEVIHVDGGYHAMAAPVRPSRP
jgi:enoyl-[acyl-carrier protein] reductase I